MSSFGCLRKNRCMILNCVGYAAFSAIIHTTIALLPDAVDRGVHCGDTSIIYPYKKEIINRWLLIVISIVPVGVLFTVINTIMVSQKTQSESSFARKKSLFSKSVLSNIFIVNISNWLLYIAGASACFILLELAKLFVGRYRPHFLSLCKPGNHSHVSWNTIGCTPGSLMLLEEFRCENTGKELENAVKSFPSGHATIAFYCAAFGVSYLELIFRRSPKWHFVKSVLETILITAAWIVSFSRVADNHHHLGDVIAGAILGTVIGYLTFSSYSEIYHQTVIDRTVGGNCELTGFARRYTGAGKPIKNTNVAGSQSFDFPSDSSDVKTKSAKIDLDDVDGVRSPAKSTTAGKAFPHNNITAFKKTSKGSVASKDSGLI